MMDNTNPEQAWFWTDKWQEGERQVEEYIRDGNVQSFDSMEEFLASLDEEIKTNSEKI